MVLKRKVYGRLGNQMFQYAFMRKVQKKYFPWAEIQLDFSEVEKAARKNGWDETDSLIDFEAPYTRVEGVYLTIPQKFWIFVLRVALWFSRHAELTDGQVRLEQDRIERKFQKILTKHNILWHTNGYVDFDFSLLNPDKDVVFFGYFESPKYFDDIRNVLLDDFKPSFGHKASNPDIYRTALLENSVCVSVRRGDFIDNPLHDICKKDYFDKAIYEIFHRVPRPKFIFFSDDIDWVKRNISLLKEHEVLYDEEDNLAVERLYMMRCCKNFVISNSTFSFWAQYLSTNPNKVVVAPSRWLNAPLSQDIYQPNWKLIQV